MLEPLFEQIHQRRSEELQKRTKPYPRNNPVASDISNCARETALAILHWQERPAFTEDLAARLEVGNQQENIAAAKLLTYGFRIVEQQSQFEYRDKNGRLIIRGKIDGKMEYERRRIPFDFKTVSPLVFPRMNTIEDFLRHPFFAKYPKQLWAYELMNNIDTGFLWLDNLMGQWKFVEIPLDYDGMEKVLKQCEAAVDSVEAVRAGKSEAEALPPYSADPAVCLRCWARGRLCTPPFFSTAEGLKLIDDPELEKKLDRLEELDVSAREYDLLDKELKEVFKGRNNLIVGKWLITGQEAVRRFKAQPAKEATEQRYWKASYEKISGDDPT